MAAKSSSIGTDSSLLNVVLLGGVAFLLYKIVTTIGSAASGAITTVGASIGDLLSKWIIPAPVNVTGKYVLQDTGALIDPTTVSVTWINSNDPAAAVYGGQLATILVNGKTYLLGSHDDNGNYPAHPFPS